MPLPVAFSAFYPEMIRYFNEGTPDNYRELAAEIAANIEAAWVGYEAESEDTGGHGLGPPEEDD